MEYKELEKMCEGESLRITQAMILAMEKHPAFEKLTTHELNSMLKIVNLCTEALIECMEDELC